MEYKEAGLPMELIYAVSKLSAKRNRVIIPPSTSQTIQSGTSSITTFELPQRAVVDLSSVSIGMYWTLYAQNNGANNVDFILPCASDLIAQSLLTVNGGMVASGSLNPYQHISQRAFYVAQTDEAYRNAHALEGLNAMYVPPTGYTDYGGRIAGGAVGQSSSLWLVYNQLPCCSTNRFLDTSIFGRSHIQIRPSGLNVIKGINLVDRNCKWDCQNLELHVDVIAELPVEYINLVKELVSQKKQFKLNIRNEVASVFTYNNSVLLNVSTQSADGLLVAPVIDEVGYVSASSDLVPPCFNFKWGKTADTPTLNTDVNLGIRVGNYAIPDGSRYTKLWSLASTTQESFYGDSLYGKNSIYVSGCDSSNNISYSTNGYARLNGIFYQNLAMLRTPGWAHYDATLSGVNTYGQDVVFQVNSSMTNAPNKLFICAQTTATVVMDAESGGVSVVY